MAPSPWYDRFDELRMVMVVDHPEDGARPLRIPARLEVCGTCLGSLPAAGGMPCPECHGRGVAPIPDHARMTPDFIVLVAAIIRRRQAQRHGGGA